MITLALDTATDRCTVAAGDGSRAAHRYLDGSRRHASAIIGMIDAVVAELDIPLRDIQRVIIADGPGSFTGLRVAASVAKAFSWRATVELRATPSLLVRAAGHAPTGGGSVLALSDALRGEVYAASWRIGGDGVVATSPAPRAMVPADLVAFLPVDVVVGSLPPALAAQVSRVTGEVGVTGDAALPDARILLQLADMPGGSVAVGDIAGWEPAYGRPSEAQVVWERTHGVELPAAFRHVG